MNEYVIGPQFIKYESLLWRLLARLARDGFVVSPDEGRDLIHDFYLDAWPGINERYNSNQSNFRTYMASAFYKFARRQIIRAQSLNHKLVNICDVGDDLLEPTELEGVVVQSLQVEKLRIALKSIRAVERDMIFDYLSESKSNERSLAKKYSLSRYGLRIAIGEAIGRLAYLLDRLELESPRDKQIAELVWDGELSNKKVAEKLGLKVGEVKKSKEIVLRGIVSELKMLKKLDKPYFDSSGGKVMNEHIGLLQRAVLSPNNELLLNEVKNNSKPILNALNEMNDFDEMEVEKSYIDSEWLARIYMLLADASSESNIEIDAYQEESISLRITEESEIIEAIFLLVDKLPDKLCDWSYWFGALPDVGLDQFNNIIEDIDRIDLNLNVIDRFEGALKKGITPLGLHGSTRAIQRCLNKLKKGYIDAEHVSESNKYRDTNKICLLKKSNEIIYAVSKEIPLTHIHGVRDLPFLASVPVYDWIMECLNEQENLINGYLFSSDQKLFYEDESVAKNGSELILRWADRKEKYQL